jgi:hypothetical protein
MPARSKESRLAHPLSSLRAFWSAQSRPRRELLTFGIALAFGLIVLPWLIWVAGALVLGPYARGGVFHFIGDFFVALGHGDGAFWLIALGPAVFLGLARLMWLALRGRAG